MNNKKFKETYDAMNKKWLSTMTTSTVLGDQSQRQSTVLEYGENEFYTESVTSRDCSYNKDKTKRTITEINSRITNNGEDINSIRIGYETLDKDSGIPISSVYREFETSEFSMDNFDSDTRSEVEIQTTNKVTCTDEYIITETISELFDDSNSCDYTKEYKQYYYEDVPKTPSALIPLDALVPRYQIYITDDNYIYTENDKCNTRTSISTTDNGYIKSVYDNNGSRCYIANTDVIDINYDDIDCKSLDLSKTINSINESISDKFEFVKDITHKVSVNDVTYEVEFFTNTVNEHRGNNGVIITDSTVTSYRLNDEDINKLVDIIKEENNNEEN